jgi:glycosyltransferase involved in cell wall biosynthesis
LARVSGSADLLVVPYNPFMYGRWGFAPRLLADIARLRARSSRPSLALLVHEPFVPVTDAKTLLMGGWQRFQLATLLVLVDRSFASIERWTANLSRVRRTTHLPSGSNLPDARSRRHAIRSELGIGARLVLASLSTGHPSHLRSYVAAALQRVTADCGPVAFLELGAGAQKVDGIPEGTIVVRAGRTPAERLAGLLAAADLMLVPFVDGVSTRRGSLMAGLQQEVAVVGTSGPLTDRVLRTAGLELVEVGNPGAFADRVALLAGDGERRKRAASTGRHLFEEAFTWDEIARRLLEEIANP